MADTTFKNKHLGNEFTIPGAMRTSKGITGTICVQNSNGTNSTYTFYSTSKIDHFYFTKGNTRYFFHWFM